MATPLHKFNVRVYGLWIRDQREVLVADEIVLGKRITKFPGGGMEFGEGPADALKREWVEELGVAVHIVRQYYFTDFFVPSFMDDGSQILSLYFEVKPIQQPGIQLKQKPFDFEEEKERAEAFRFISLSELQPDHLTLPIDQHVASLLSSMG